MSSVTEQSQSDIFTSSRRQFLRSAAIGSAFAFSAPSLLRADKEVAKGDGKSPFRISVAEWSLHKALQSKKITNLDFPRIAKEEFGIEAVEYVNQFFKDKAQDKTYLDDLNKRCADYGVKSLLIMVDGEGALGDADDAKRAKAVENHLRWLEAAKHLGCHSIRVNAQSSGEYSEQQKLAADGLRRLSEAAEPMGLNVLVENHGGLSSNGAWLAGVMKMVGRANCGTLPDFGNFRIKDGEEYDRYKGVDELMPFAKAVSAKSYDFDDAGNETKIDFAKMMDIVLKHGYKGFVGIEYEGSRLDEYAGVKATKSLLEKIAVAKA